MARSELLEELHSLMQNAEFRKLLPELDEY